MADSPILSKLLAEKSGNWSPRLEPSLRPGWRIWMRLPSILDQSVASFLPSANTGFSRKRQQNNVVSAP